jgi:hypothetical protein
MNGKEIYDGDIVENEFGDKGVVKYDSNNACYYVENLEFKRWYNLEVIGNIFENP